MHGTTCFGCSGRKVKLTKRGYAAQQWLIKQQSKPVSELQVGDLIREEDFFSSLIAWMRIDKIEVDADGRFNLSVSYQRKHETTRRELGFNGLPATDTKRVRPGTKAELRWQQMVGLAYQATLTKAGTVRKARKAA
jgi:hypothetical protein